MALITIDIDTIPGEATITGHTNELEALAVRDLVVAPTGSARAKVAEIFLTRYVDKGSPKLAEACSMGTNVGTVTINFFKNATTGPTVYMKYVLTDTFVSRVEFATGDSAGNAFLPYDGWAGKAGHEFGAMWRKSGANQNADRNYARFRANPDPIFPAPLGTSTNDEIERVWLSPATIKWNWSPKSNAVEKGYNLQTGVAT